MTGKKAKNKIYEAWLCVIVCTQLFFPKAVSAATKTAIEKAGDAFVSENVKVNETENKTGKRTDTEEETTEETNMESESEEDTVSEDTIRQEIIDFALQFEGNPYVYGGTSLTNGADCSGFVMAVFAEFGYSLPRVAADQYYQSTQKTVENLKPGDLIFYGNGISHVALYIGDGKIIHASTSTTGIKISDYDYQTPVGVGTYITEEAEGFFGD